ncbi:hypothetical protein [Geodermatophilus obscurus]|uniref:hypothetical protein n=1 Tax=Geodermatophilus obscurus TaxID=1861 RepID=UPI00140F6C43|nr:hypothetical protein [Geodermatophilus obscurus]
MGPTSQLATTSQTTVVSAPLAVLSVTALAVYRILHVAIVLSPGLVTIRGLRSTRSVRAADVLRFGPPPPHGTLLRAGLRVVLLDCRVLTAAVSGHGGLDDESVGHAECAELNRWLESGEGRSAVVPLMR